ncbi:MAG: DUF2797 domain-containing protein [Pseudomonadales bacterium]|jgi:hypothetical protein
MQGSLRKMTSRHNDPVDYYLTLGDDEIHLNPYIGSRIRLRFSGKISCLHCGRLTKKSFSQGYCFPCFRKLAECDLCLMSPERCHFDAGTCRDESFAERFCMNEHIVYLANSTGIKVGITRRENIPTRWIDQGAVQALPVFSVQTRQQSGFVEVAFKAHISDKTHWQRMLKETPEHIDLPALRDQLLLDISEDIKALQERFGIQAVQAITDAEVQTFNYPVEQHPTKVKSMNFDKMPEVEGVLQGIKAQYLIFDIGVINLRKFTSYEVEFTPC